MLFCLTRQNLGQVFNSRHGRTCLCRAIVLVPKIAKLKVENSAQTTFRLSPFRFLATRLKCYHRHLSNINCVMILPALFASLVLLMAAAKKKKPWKTGASNGHKTNLKQSIWETFDIITNLKESIFETFNIFECYSREY
jgi:hypothetical protein